MLAISIAKSSFPDHFNEPCYSIQSNSIETITTFSRPIAKMNEDGMLLAMKWYMKDPHDTEYWICKCENCRKRIKGYSYPTWHIKTYFKINRGTISIELISDDSWKDFRLISCHSYVLLPFSFVENEYLRIFFLFVVVCRNRLMRYINLLKKGVRRNRREIAREFWPHIWQVHMRKNTLHSHFSSIYIIWKNLVTVQYYCLFDHWSTEWL